MSQGVQAGSEPGFAPVTMLGTSDVALWLDDFGAGMGPSDSQGDDCQQQGKLWRLGEVRVLHVEAARLGFAEQAFDLPALL